MSFVRASYYLGCARTIHCFVTDLLHMVSLTRQLGQYLFLNQSQNLSASIPHSLSAPRDLCLHAPSPIVATPGSF